MKKILLLLYAFLCCAIGMVRAQTVYVNTPDKVCIDTSGIISQRKYLSINAMIVTSSRYTVSEQASWSIAGPTGTDADYEILYTANSGAATKAGKLQKTKSLTLQFLVPGTYTVTITMPYKDNGTNKTRTEVRTIQAINCTINVCGSNESNDKPGFFEDFGTMAANQTRRKYPIDGVVTYDYQGTGELADNYYSISNTTKLKGDWVDNTDHTGNTRGAMLVANSAYEPKRMYQKTVTGLCKGSVYNFSAWLININPIGVFESGCVSKYQYAGVTFVVVNAANPTQVLAEFPTYNVSMDLSKTNSSWQKYGGSFTVPSSIDSVKVIIENDMPGGCGNDIAVDDIEFAYCSPNITASIEGSKDNLAEVVCEGAPITLLSNYTPVNYFKNPAYQWEMSDDEGLTWKNVPFGTNTSKNLVIANGELKGTRTVPTSYRFRVRVYEVGSDAVTCAAPSEYIRLTILPMPQLYLTKSMVCAGAFVELQASGGFDRFKWADTADYEGATRTIRVLGDTTITVYGFVDYADGHTCMDSNKAFISSVEKPIVEVVSTKQDVCVGSTVDFRINDALAGHVIRWYRGDAVTGTPMPEYDDMTEATQVLMTTPGQNIFTVVVEDKTGTCHVESAPFYVNVTAFPIPNAGPDQALCASMNSSGNFNLNAVLAAGETGVWTVENITGPAAPADMSTIDIKEWVGIQFPNLPKTRVTVKKGGITVTLKWTVKPNSNATCSAADYVDVSLLFDPSLSDAGRDTTLCGTANVFTMDASQPDLTLTGPYKETGTWKLISGNATIADIHAYNTTVTSLSNEQDIVLSWTITNTAGCTPNEDFVVLHKTTRPVITLKPNITTCNNDGTFVLDTISTKGNPDIYSLTPGTPALPGFTPIMNDSLKWPLVISYPAGTAPGTYRFNLSYRNSLAAGCDSTIPVDVHVETPPIAATGIAVGTPNICVSGTSTLTVIGGDLGQKADGTPNGRWAWYSGSCGGTFIAYGNSITVPVTATTTYYVRAESLGVCDTTACVSATVTVYQAPNPADAGPDQSKCNTPSFTMAANDASVGVGKWSIVTISGPAGSFPATTADSTNKNVVITVPAGSVVDATWTITNGVCVTSDVVRLTNYVLPVSNAGPNQIQCNNTQFTMNANPQTAPVVGKWSLAAGSPGSFAVADSTKYNAVFTVPVGQTATAIWTVTNGVCVVTSQVTLTNSALPVSNAGADQRQCNNDKFTMNANPQTTPAVGKWSLAAGSPGSFAVTDSTNPAAVFTVPVGQTATAIWTVTNGACIVTDAVTLINDAPPTPANAGPDQRQCNNTQFTMNAAAVTVGVGKWSFAAGSPGSFAVTDSSNRNAVFTVPVGQTANVIWTVTNGTCVSTDNVTLINDAPATPAAAGPDQEKCNDTQFTMNAGNVTVGVGKWSLTTISGNPGSFAVTDSTNRTAVITVPVGSVIDAVWTVTNGTCSSTDVVRLTNYEAPAPANAGADQRHCNDAAFDMNANAASVGTGKWSLVQISGPAASFPATDSTNRNVRITVPAGATVDAVWTITNGTCVTSDIVRLINDEAPTPANAGVDQKECNNTSTFTLNANAASVGTGTWTVVYTKSGFVFPAGLVNTPGAGISVTPGDSVILRWTITNGNCTTSDDVTIVNYEQPAPADAGPDQAKCAGTDFVTNASTPSVTGAVGLWTVIKGNATIRAGEENLPVAHISVANGDTAVLRWTITNGTCSTFDEVTLINFLTPSPANAGPDQRECNISTFTMAANAPDVPGATGTWTLVAGSAGSITPGDENKPDAVINVPVGDTTYAIWTISNGTCPSQDTVKLVNDAMPTLAAAGPDQEKCADSLFTMAATPVTVGIGKWSLNAGSKGFFAVADSTNPNAVISVPAGETVTATWTTTNGYCVTTDDVVLTNYKAPLPANAGKDQEQCNNDRFVMDANTASVGTGKWSLVPVTGTGASFAVTDSTNPKAAITVPAGVVVNAVWTITNGVCVTIDTVKLTNYQAPAPAVAGPDQEKCNDPLFTMAAGAPTVGVGKWSLVFVKGTGASFAVTDSTNRNAVINVPAGEIVNVVWTITNGTCVTSDIVTLTNYEMPTAANAGIDQEKCNTPTFTMDANAASVGTGKWSLIPVTGTGASFAVTDSTNPKATINVPVGVIVDAVWTITNGVCVTTDAVRLTNYEAPAPANAGGDLTHCNNDQFVMNAQAASVGTGKWSLVTVTGTGASFAVADSTNPKATITVPAGVTVDAVWTIRNGVCMTTDTVRLINYEMPANANAGADQTNCNNSMFTMAANTPSPATAKGVWTIVSGNATITNPNSPVTTVTVNPGQTAVLRWTITNGTCTSVPDDVTLINQAAILGNTISADQLLCATQTPAALTGSTLSGGNGTYTYQWQVSTTSATAGFANITVGGTNATFNPPMITMDTWYRRLVTSGACTNDTSNAVKLSLMNKPPVVISVPGPITRDCVQGTDYTTLFGTPTFSSPYPGELLTVTQNDVTVTVDRCTFTIMRTWTATDRCGMTTQAQQTITVVDRTAPVFTSPAPANITVDCDKVPAMVNLTANDACNGAMTITPIEVRIDQPGACVSNYQLIRKWVAVDACGNASDTLRQVITVKDMTPPVFSAPAPANITVDCDKVPAGAPLTATDNCTPGNIVAVPVDIRKDIPGSKCADNYQIIRTWTATDLCGNKTVLTQTITVQDTIKPRFSMSVPPSITVDCDKVPSVATITATDNCTSMVNVKLTERRDNLSTTCLANYKLTRTWTATDNCGNTSVMQQVITVQDTTRPEFVALPPADTTVSCDAVPAPPTNLKATDNCSTVKISYTQVRESISGACASSYRLIRTWTAKDACNNTNTFRQVITVTDTTRPVIDPAPANVTVNCGQTVPAAATLYARDNCDATFPKKATMTQDPFTVDLCNGYTITRRWTISDACGNMATERVQIITVNPCPKPALVPELPANCSNNTKFAVMLANKVTRPKFTLVSVVPANAVPTPLTQTSNVFDLNGATQATFTVTDGVTGCVSDPITYNLQYVMKPVVNLGSDVAICQGDNVTLDAGAANAAYSIRWSTGATTQTIDVNTAGNYWATVTNGICTTADTVKVTVNKPPVVNLRDTAICQGESVMLNAFVQGGSYVWNTGQTTASITVNTTGTYSVDVTVNGCTTHKDVVVLVGTPPNIVLTDDTEICPAETVMLTVDPDGGTVRWNTGETTNSIVVSRAGDYQVTVTRDGCVVKDNVTVTERPDLDIDLGPNRDFCIGGRVVLDATHPDAISYLWNDGDTNPVKEVTAAGKYVVSVMDRFCSRITMDSVNVTVAGIPEFDLGRDTVMCITEELTLKVNAGTGNSIRWQDGSTSSTYKVTGPGTYSVTVYNECGSVTDQINVGYKPCEAKPQFPTGFTPNGDGLNDIFKPVVRGPMYDYDLRIYNRWGELIFLSKDQKNGWDGRYKGALVENGTYVWMLTYKKVMGGASNIIKGEVTAIR